MGADDLTVSMDKALFLSLIELATAAAASHSTLVGIDRLASGVLGPCRSEELGKACQGYDGHPGVHKFRTRDGRVSLTWEESF